MHLTIILKHYQGTIRKHDNDTEPVEQAILSVKNYELLVSTANVFIAIAYLVDAVTIKYTYCVHANYVNLVMCNVD